MKEDTMSPKDQFDGRALPGWGRVASLTAGLMAMGGAVYQVVTPGSPQFSLSSASDWVRELSFLAYLVSTCVAVVAARRVGLVTRGPGILVPLGYGLIALGVLAGLVLREDPEWFFLVGGPGNLLAAIGFVWWAIAGWRSGTLPGWASLLLGVGGFFAVLFGEFGTGLLIGSFWVWLAVTGTRGTADVGLGSGEAAAIAQGRTPGRS
jgi:hypothetical protein